MERWFAVCCKPRQEMIAHEHLLRQRYSVYLPRIKVRKRRAGKWVEVVEALFPRYIFMHVDPAKNSLAPVRSTRGVVGLVRFGGQPAVVPDEVMAELRRREDEMSGLHPDDRAQFNVGEPVRLVEGPLAGMEAVFAQLDGEKRVIVLLELLGKTNKMSVNRDWLVQAA